ncbi:hypothetical protein [Pelomonas sp. KK5]|uniref:hypothetical protein n=1 Tax=Pelomonas sp. KK5 TaxID=1855730 RepID=UPI00097C09B9|nr:hypothetical protein [Pelomonas sp. KK5]
MKVAIALFGIPRASALTMPSIERHFIGPVRQMGECRVFHHLFLMDRVVDPRSGENAPMPPAAYAPFEAFDGELEAPGECLAQHGFAQIRRHGDAYGDGFSTLANLIHQLHSLSRVTRRLAAWEPDLVLYLRPDLRYEGGFAAAEFDSALRQPRRCILPEWQWWGGYNDRFALCGAEAYRAYGKRLEWALDYSERTGRPLHAERLLRHALRRGGASVRTTTLQAHRVRADGQVKQEDFDVATTAGSVRRRLELFGFQLLGRLSI